MMVDVDDDGCENKDEKEEAEIHPVFLLRLLVIRVFFVFVFVFVFVFLPFCFAPSFSFLSLLLCSFHFISP